MLGKILFYIGKLFGYGQYFILSNDEIVNKQCGHLATIMAHLVCVHLKAGAMASVNNSCRQLYYLKYNCSNEKASKPKNVLNKKLCSHE